MTSFSISLIYESKTCKGIDPVFARLLNNKTTHKTFILMIGGTYYERKKHY